MLGMLEEKGGMKMVMDALMIHTNCHDTVY